MLIIHTYIDRCRDWLFKEKEQPKQLSEEEVFLNNLFIISEKEWCQKMFHAENASVKVNVLYPNIYEYAKQLSRINLQLQKNNPIVQENIPSQSKLVYLTDFYIDDDGNTRKDLTETNVYFYNLVKEFLLLRKKVIEENASESAIRVHFRNLSSTQSIKDNLYGLSKSFMEIQCQKNY